MVDHTEMFQLEDGERALLTELVEMPKVVLLEDVNPDVNAWIGHLVRLGLAYKFKAVPGREVWTATMAGMLVSNFAKSGRSRFGDIEVSFADSEQAEAMLLAMLGQAWTMSSALPKEAFPVQVRVKFAGFAAEGCVWRRSETR